MRLASLAAVPLLALAACGSSTPSPPAPEATPSPSPTPRATEGSLVLGPWATYPSPAADLPPSAPLDDHRWAQATAELACSDRAHQGDPAAQTDRSARILARFQTSAKEVMAYGVEVNADPERALRWGGMIAAAAENCR